jgi:alkylhydroperoxidase/carboxymuconolactone decarboxylase family protein YurZ
MAATHPDLPIFAINHLYAPAISDVTILDAQATVLVNFSVTVATDSGPQAKGHIHGCKNFGCEKWEIQSAIKVVTLLAEELRKAGALKISWDTMPFIRKFGGKLPGDQDWEKWAREDEKVQARL